MNNQFFLAKLRYTKHLDNGGLKRVNEHFLFQAYTFTDVEASIYEQLGSVIRGEFIIQAIERKTFKDIFFYDDSEKWWLCKVVYDLENDNGKKKEVKMNFLVTSENAKQSTERIKENLSPMIEDFRIVSTSETKIVEIFPL